MRDIAENLHASGRDMRKPSCKFRRCTCARVEIKKNKNPNMVLYYEKTPYTNIDARDGRERDALLRASARNPAAHSNVFVSFGSD